MSMHDRLDPICEDLERSAIVRAVMRESLASDESFTVLKELNNSWNGKLTRDSLRA